MGNRESSEVEQLGDKLAEILEEKRLDCPSRENETAGRLYCPTLFDGILCWPAIEPGETKQPCPEYFPGFDSKNNASRQCLENGSWFDWTNYSECSNSSFTIMVDASNKHSHIWNTQNIRMVSHVGYGISANTLIIAFIILASFRKLHCPRNMLHLHLFFSFIMRATMHFIKHAAFEEGIGTSSTFRENNGTRLFHEEINWECKTVTAIWQYFIVASYSWVLMEGFYIHNLIMRALSSDGSSIIGYIILGWGLPLFVVPPWVAARILVEDELCWTLNKYDVIEKIITIPIIISIMINFILFVNINRVLMSKVRTSIQEEAKRYWRLAKSMLILVAIFSVPQFLTMSFYFVNDETFERIWVYCHQIYSSFQGLFMALLYCYLNSEVQEEMKKKWRKYIYKGGGTENSFRTTSFASWSSSLSMAHGPCGLAYLRHHLRRLLTCGYRPESRASKISETVDCTVSFYDPQALALGDKPCEQDEDSAVEMKLMGKTVND